jgi:prepilin-type N-terminal cleavage/methylation domain-containing protein
MHHPTQHHARHSRRERAFTLIEMIIVLIIMLVLAAAAVALLGSSKSATRAKEASAAGAAYAQAISQFQADNANKLPALAGANTDAVRKGPVNLLAKPYLKSMPDGVAAGRVNVFAGTLGGAHCNGTPSAPTDAGTGWVSMCFAATPPDYGVRVATRKDTGTPWSDPTSKVCWFGRTANAPRC